MESESGRRINLFIKKHGGKVEMASMEEIRVRFSKASKASDFYKAIKDNLDWKDGLVCSNTVVTIYSKPLDA